MNAVIARILLRVLAGILIGKGVSVEITDILSDPDIAVGVEAVVGFVIWGATEVYYYLAKRFGWAT